MTKLLWTQYDDSGRVIGYVLTTAVAPYTVIAEPDAVSGTEPDIVEVHLGPGTTECQRLDLGVLRDICRDLGMTLHEPCTDQEDSVDYAMRVYASCLSWLHTC
jgi:hypothetical protein